MADTVPAHVMTPERLAISRSLGLASAIPFTQAPQDDPREREGLPEPTPAPVAPIRPQLVGQTITGRQWLVLQLPSGGIRAERESETDARAEARRLAAAESGEFGVFQPRGISRPQTTVTDELL